MHAEVNVNSIIIILNLIKIGWWLTCKQKFLHTLSPALDPWRSLSFQFWLLRPLRPSAGRSLHREMTSTRLTYAIHLVIAVEIREPENTIHFEIDR